MKKQTISLYGAIILHNAINIAFAIILQKKNTCDIDIAGHLFGDIRDLL